MDVHFHREDRIILTLKNGQCYEGNVRNFNVTSRRLSLKNVLEYPSGKSIEGCRYFEADEVAQIKLSEVIESAESDIKERHKVPAKESESRRYYKINDQELTELQNSFCYIDKHTNFYAALSMIKENKIIGLLVKDADTGRQGRGSVVVISTKCKIFIFDLEVLGDGVFDLGLRDILESHSIIKVVYDCRLLSDCLYHKHCTTLSNVRDVEAEDIIVVHQERGCIRKHVRPFDYLVRLYLGMSNEILDETNLTDSWKQRPLTCKQQKFLLTWASLLIPLHEAIQAHYLQRLADASNIYNECVRDSDAYAFVTENYNYVSRKPLLALVKHKETCRYVKDI